MPVPFFLEAGFRAWIVGANTTVGADKPLSGLLDIKLP